ncbi:MAG: RNA polymerase-binding protein DksA [Nitrospirae bacterium]|nr:RNA polymerase-binding protein DksA [Nitrospirota bacterium]
MAKKKTKKTIAKKATKKGKKQTPKAPKKQVKPKKVVKETKKIDVKKPAAKKTETKKIGKVSPREKKILEIKKSLLSQKEMLLKEAEEALNSLPGEINFPDMGDQATAETDRNFMLRLRDRERMLLKKIDETLEQIDSATYGICSECGNGIDIKRLEARPVTTLCIDCKVRQEEEERIAEGR